MRHVGIGPRGLVLGDGPIQSKPGALRARRRIFVRFVPSLLGFDVESFERHPERVRPGPRDRTPAHDASEDASLDDRGDLMTKLLCRFVDLVADHAGAKHVRITWSARTGESGSIRVPRFEAAHYVQQLRSRFGRLASLRVIPD